MCENTIKYTNSAHRFKGNMMLSSSVGSLTNISNFNPKED